MSVKENPTETYCEPKDVYKYFRVMAGDADGFSETTNPSDSMVKDFIEDASARIDRETGHAWRERRVVNEMKDLDGQYYFWAGTPISTMKREVRTPLKSEKGDKIEVYDGNGYDDWVASDEYEEGRDEDYWVSRADGLLYIYRRSTWFQKYQSIRLSYRYGAEHVPSDIKNAAAKLAAADVMRTDIFGDIIPAGNDGIDVNSTADTLEEQAMRVCENRSEVRRM